MISLDSTFKDETKYQKNVTITSYDDEYLAYSVAFSIPNKITSRFNEVLMNSNIILQRIDKFIRS